jgi:hypothetical protein
MPRSHRRSIKEVLRSKARQQYQHDAAKQVRNSTLNTSSLESTNNFITRVENARRRLVRDAKDELDNGLEYSNRYWRAVFLLPALLWLYFFFNYHPFVHLFELDKGVEDGANTLVTNSIVFGTSLVLVVAAVGISSARHNAREHRSGELFWHIVTALFFFGSVLASLSLQLALLKPDATFNAADWAAVGFKVLLIFAAEAGILYADECLFFGLAWVQTWLVLIVIGIVSIVARWRQRSLNTAITGSVGGLGTLAEEYRDANNEEIFTPPVAAKTRQGFRDVMGYDVIPEPSPPANPAPVDGNPTRTTETERPPTPAQTPPAEEPHQPNPEATIDPDEGMAEENARLRRELEARARRDEEEVRP